MNHVKEKKPAYGAGQAVQGEILIMKKIDWSHCIGDTRPEDWTHGPVLPVGGEKLPARKRREATGPKKRTKR